VKLEMLIGPVLPWVLQKETVQNLSHLNRVLQIRQIWTQLITACGKYCKTRCTKHASLIRSYQRCHWRMAATTTTIPIGPLRYQSLFQFVQIMYTFCRS